MFAQKTLALLVGACVTIATATPSLAAERLKISGQHATDHPATIALNVVADAIKDADVDLSAKVFPSNQLVVHPHDKLGFSRSGSSLRQGVFCEGVLEYFEQRQRRCSSCRSGPKGASRRIPARVTFA